LLLLSGRRDPPRTAADLAQELRIDPSWVEAQLKAMAGRGLLEAAVGSPPSYRYAPRTPALEAAVADLARAYADRRVTVIGLIFSKPVDKIRSFADAFRLRKDSSDG
jgi:predicted ArsR family transcriptional regulator